MGDDEVKEEDEGGLEWGFLGDIEGVKGVKDKKRFLLQRKMSVYVYIFTLYSYVFWLFEQTQTREKCKDWISRYSRGVSLIRFSSSDCPGPFLKISVSNLTPAVSLYG